MEEPPMADLGTVLEDKCSAFHSPAHRECRFISVILAGIVVGLLASMTGCARPMNVAITVPAEDAVAPSSSGLNELLSLQRKVSKKALVMAEQILANGQEEVPVRFVKATIDGQRLHGLQVTILAFTMSHKEITLYTLSPLVAAGLRYRAFTLHGISRQYGAGSPLFKYVLLCGLRHGEVWHTEASELYEKTNDPTIAAMCAQVIAKGRCFSDVQLLKKARWFGQDSKAGVVVRTMVAKLERYVPLPPKERFPDPERTPVVYPESQPTE